MHNIDYVNSLISRYKTAAIDQHLSPNETMNNEWYFPVGRSAVDNILLGCLASGITDVRSVLDVPCGHGRVLRHLVALFEGSKFHACDLDQDGVEFCASTFGATPIVSRAELTEVDFGTTFDLIWVGSLFTHTSRELTKRWMTHLARFLSPNGIIVATLHGRWCERVHTVAPYIAQERWETILRDYRATGHGYSDYSNEETHSYIEGSYGISLTRPRVTLEDIETIPGVRIHSYRERAWVDHQDVIVFGRPAYDVPWPWMTAA